MPQSKSKTSPTSEGATPPGGESTGTPPETGDGPGTGTQAGATSGTGTPPADEAKFTQADLDRFVQDRLDRDRKARGDNQATLQEQIDALRADNEAAKSARESADAAKARALREKELVSAAAKAGAADPGDVVAFVSDDQFGADDFDAEQLAGGVLTEKPYLKAATGNRLTAGAQGTGPAELGDMDMDTYMTHRKPT